MIKVENLSMLFSTEEVQTKALNEVTFEIEKGEFVAIMGPSGCGKSTLLNILGTLDTPTSGSYLFEGKRVDKMNENQLTALRKGNIGFIFQSFNLIDELTVYENIDYFCGLYIKDKEKRRKCVEETMDFVDIADYRKFLPKKLSGGLLRRLNIACGIAHKPKLIFFDEPTVAVDPQSRNRILEGIKRLNEEGATIVYTSHYMEEVEQLCDRIVIMDKGKSVAVGTKEELKKMIKNTETIKVEVLGLTGKQISELRRQPHMYEEEYSDGMLTLRYSGGRHNLVRLMEFFKEHDISFGRVVTELPTLNDVFLEITGKELRD